MCQIQIIFCWNKSVSSLFLSCCFHCCFFLQAEEMSFHLLAIQILRKHLISFALELFFLPFHWDVHWKQNKIKQKPNQPKLTNPATNLLLSNENKTVLIILWHIWRYNLVVNHKELMSNPKSAIAVLICWY